MTRHPTGNVRQGREAKPKQTECTLNIFICRFCWIIKDSNSDKIHLYGVWLIKCTHVYLRAQCVKDHLRRFESGKTKAHEVHTLVWKWILERGKIKSKNNLCLSTTLLLIFYVGVTQLNLKTWRPMKRGFWCFAVYAGALMTIRVNKLCPLSYVHYL